MRNFSHLTSSRSLSPPGSPSSSWCRDPPGSPAPSFSWWALWGRNAGPLLPGCSQFLWAEIEEDSKGKNFKNRRQNYFLSNLELLCNSWRHSLKVTGHQCGLVHIPGTEGVSVIRLELLLFPAAAWTVTQIMETLQRPRSPTPTHLSCCQPLSSSWCWVPRWFRAWALFQSEQSGGNAGRHFPNWWRVLSLSQRSEGGSDR